MSLNRYLLPLNLLGELVIISLWVLLSGVIPTLLDIFFFLTFCWMVSTLLTKNYYINRLPGILINALEATIFPALMIRNLFCPPRLIFSAKMPVSIGSHWS